MKASLYFFILYDRPEKVSDSDISFVVPEKKSEMPECLYTYEKYDDKKYKYNKIYKVDKSLGKGEKKNEYYFEFIIKEEKYRISFDSKGNTFVYDIRLVFGKKILEIVRNISQNKEYIKKTEIFIEALKENKEETLIDTLYKETLHLYKKKKGFSFLIGLFVKIYKKKDLCSKLLKTFKEMNDNKKDNEKNQDRKPFLKDYIPDLEKIKSEADKYNTIDFYGIILSYFNYYDYNKFGSILKELYDKKPKDLFEIMIIYNTHLKNLIRENSDFFNKFISYTIENKDFDCFGKALNYINDIETFLIAITYCIENNKEDILSKCKDNDKIIKLDNLKFKEKEKNKGKNIIISSDESSNNYIKRTLEMIEEIINFSSENDMVLVHFTNSFWYYILNCFNEPNQENIENCNKIRMTFIKYYDLVTKVIKKNENKIKKDVINYYEKDEFAILLDEIIRKYLNHEKSLTNIEKLGFISKHNPFYNKENINFSNKRELDILDLFNLNDINNDFVHDFKGMGFESIFKDKLPEYIKKIMDKIKTVKNFIPTIELINIDNLDNKNLFLDILNKKYENIIVNNIKNLKSQDLKEAIDVIVQITLKNYFYQDGQKKFDFIENQIKSLDKSIIADIFIEILNVLYNKNDNEDENIDKEDENRDKEDNSEEEKNNIEEENSNKDEDYNEEENDKFYQLRNYIIDEFSKNINNSSDINNIIKLINIFKGNNKINDNENNQNINHTEKEIKNIKIINEILNKLIKAHSFNRDDFFSNNQNINIELLYALYKNEIITKDEHNNQDYYEEIQNVLKEIKNDILGIGLSQKGLKKINFFQDLLLNFKELNLSDNRIVNIDILEKVNLNSLEKLDLSYNEIFDINVLSKIDCKKIKELNLSGNRISDIKVLAKVNFKNLKLLNLHKNLIENIDILNNVNAKILEELILSCNKISSFDLFKNNNNNFTRLKILNLGGNEIPNISELQKLNFGKLTIISDIKFLDIVYMIDSTGGMNPWISIIRSALNTIYNKLNKNIILRKYDIRFGGIFYRDPIDDHFSIHEYQYLGDANDLVKKMEIIRAENGGDEPEDWVGAYTIALDKDKMKWRKDSVKIIIHIAETGAHGKKFSHLDHHPEQGPKLVCLIKKCAEERISIFGYGIGYHHLAVKSFEVCKRIYDEVKYKNYSFDIHDLYYLDSYNKFTIGEFADIIIKHILDFISQNNHK